MEELKEPPAPADPEEVASIARQGIIGQCLYGALNDIVAEDAAKEESEKQEAVAQSLDDKDEEEDSVDPATKEPQLYLKKHMADNVIKEFGHAVASTKWTSTKKNPQKEPPAALIRGRLDHYNRFHGKWRIIVRDAQFKRRGTLDKDRKSRNPRPLWDALPGRGTTDTVSFQMLAYDDL